MSEIGWIKLHRKILDNPIFLKPDLYQLFSYCLLRANHSEKKIIWNSKEEILEKGCFITGRKVIADALKQREGTIYDRLKVLRNLEMITVKSNNKYSVVKVLNYSIYQGEEVETQQPANNQPTTNQQPANTDKNVKNDKNDKNVKKSISSCRTNKFADDAIEISLACELYDLILKNNPNAKKPNLQTWAKSIDLMIRVDDRSVFDIQEVIQWSQRDSFWQGNILSTKKLREKYDQLTMKMKSVKQSDKQPNRPKGFDAIDQWVKMTEGMDENE